MGLGCLNPGKCNCCTDDYSERIDEFSSGNLWPCYFSKLSTSAFHQISTSTTRAVADSLIWGQSGGELTHDGGNVSTLNDYIGAKMNRLTGALVEETIVQANTVNWQAITGGNERRLHISAGTRIDFSFREFDFGSDQKRISYGGVIPGYPLGYWPISDDITDEIILQFELDSDKRTGRFYLTVNGNTPTGNVVSGGYEFGDDITFPVDYDGSGTENPMYQGIGFPERTSGNTVERLELRVYAGSVLVPI